MIIFNIVLKDKCGSVIIYIDHGSTKKKLEIDKSRALSCKARSKVQAVSLIESST